MATTAPEETHDATTMTTMSVLCVTQFGYVFDKDIADKTTTTTTTISGVTASLHTTAELL